MQFNNDGRGLHNGVGDVIWKDEELLDTIVPPSKPRGFMRRERADRTTFFRDK